MTHAFSALGLSIGMGLSVSVLPQSADQTTVTVPQGVILDSLDLHAKVRELCGVGGESEAGWRLLAQLSALNRRDNPRRDEFICDEIARLAASGMRLGWGAEMLMTWVTGDAGVQLIRRLATFSGSETPEQTKRFLAKILCRLGGDSDREIVGRLLSCMTVLDESEFPVDDLRGMRPTEKRLAGIGVTLVPSFAAPSVDGTACVYQALRLLRTWPTTPVDMAVRREAADVVVRIGAKDMASVLRIVAESLRVPVEAFPGAEELWRAGGQVVLKDRFRADSGHGIACGLHTAEPRAFGETITSGVLSVRQIELMLEVIQEDVGSDRTPHYAASLYQWINDHWRELDGQRFLRAAATWMVSASYYIADRQTEELALLGALDLRTIGSSDPWRLHKIAQYLRWRFPEDLVPELQVHVACGIGCGVSESQIVAIEQLLENASSKFRYDATTRRFVHRKEDGN